MAQVGADGARPIDLIVPRAQVALGAVEASGDCLPQGICEFTLQILNYFPHDLARRVLRIELWILRKNADLDPPPARDRAAVGRLDTRAIMVVGLSISALALWQMVHFDLSMSSQPVLISVGGWSWSRRQLASFTRP